MTLLVPGTHVRLTRRLAADPDIAVGTKGIIEETTYALQPEAERYVVCFNVRGLQIPKLSGFSSLEDGLIEALAGEASPLQYETEIRLWVAVDAVEAMG